MLKISPTHVVGWVDADVMECVRADARYPVEDEYTLDQWFKYVTYPADQLYFLSARLPYYADPIRALVRLAFSPAERAIAATGPHSPIVTASTEAVRRWFERPGHVLAVKIDRAALAAAAPDPRTGPSSLSDTAFATAAAAHAVTRVAELLYALGAYPFERPEAAMAAVGHIQEARELALLAINHVGEHASQEEDMRQEIQRMSAA